MFLRRSLVSSLGTAAVQFSEKLYNESGGAGRLFPTSIILALSVSSGKEAARQTHPNFIGTWSASKCRLPLIKSASNFGTSGTRERK